VVASCHFGSPELEITQQFACGGPLGRVDQAVAALVKDLQVRGLLDSTRVLVMGEFGRGPVLNKNGGRDHWPNCMSMLVAGGGLTHGQVIGSTDAKGST